jgi:hypothetical protein
MGIIRKDKEAYQIYENQQLGILVAVLNENTPQIKAFYKKKKEQAKDEIKGYEFILDEETDSLKIDFTKEKTFKISDLKKFK